MVKKYGLNMLVTTDDGLQNYLKKIMSQLNGESLLTLRANARPMRVIATSAECPATDHVTTILS